MEEELQVAIAELIGILFKTHKQQTLPLAELLFTQVLPKVLDPAVSDKMHKFGLFLIDDMVEYLGYELMASKWNDFATALKMFSSDKSCQVRQAAVYGIGMFALNTPTAHFTPFAESLISALVETAKIPQGTEKVKEHGHAQDNAVASIGKIIKTHNIVQPEVITFWLSCLPMKYDKPEAHVQHAFLADLIIARPDLITSSPDNITKAIQTFGAVLDTKLLLKENTPAVSQALKVLSTNSFVTSNFANIIATLTQEQKDRLQAAFTA